MSARPQELPRSEALRQEEHCSNRESVGVIGYALATGQSSRVEPLAICELQCTALTTEGS